MESEQKETPKKKKPRAVASSSEHKKLVELMEKNLKWSQLIYEQNEKMLKSQRRMAFVAYLKLLIIVVPLVLAVIYLPPLVEDLFAQYQHLLGAGTAGGDIGKILSNMTSDEINTIFENLKQQ